MPRFSSFKRKVRQAICLIGRWLLASSRELDRLDEYTILRTSYCQTISQGGSDETGEKDNLSGSW